MMEVAVWVRRVVDAEVFAEASLAASLFVVVVSAESEGAVDDEVDASAEARAVL